MPDGSTKVLFIAAEAAPMVKVGGLADVGGALPKALKALNYDVRLMLPAYGTLDRQKWNIRPSGKSFAVNLGGEPQAATIYNGVMGDVLVYYLDHAPAFSSQPAIYTTFYEDPARFVIFSNLALTALSHLDWQPDIIHLNDWHTAILARWLYYLRSELRTPPTLLTIHNLDYQGIVHRSSLGWVANLLPVTADHVVNLLYEGIAYADVITTVSPTYAQQIMTPACGAGLQHILRNRADDLVGILNGIDVEFFNPATDRFIAAHYSVDDLSGKAECKRALQTKAELPLRSDVPIFGMVSRLVEQKGLDILTQALPQLFTRHDCQLIVLGTGDERYQRQLSDLADHYENKFRLWLRFDGALAQWIYAGSDAFLMPSRFEPCGLGQMIAMRYGTVPVVHATGGLADTVNDVTTDDGTGICFDYYHPDGLAYAVERTLDAFKDKQLWCGVIERGMRRDFSWTRSAQHYGELYGRIISSF